LAYPVKLARVAQAARQAQAHPDQVRLLYGDECSLYRQPTLGAVYTLVGAEPRARLAARANTRYRLSGALDALSGQVIWTAGTKMGVRGLRQFLTTLRTGYPAHTLFLVWDNWPVHQHPEVLTHAAAQEIQLLWLPTYAPWTNPIEKLWRWLKQELVPHHRLADQWEPLKSQATTFLNQFAHGSRALLRYVGLLPD
jgi:hypothetical protein